MRLALVGAAGLGVSVGCLIPDQGILVLTTDVNLYPVRFVEGIPLDDAALCACDPDNCECPLPAFTALPYYLNPDDASYQFCICDEDRVDEGQLPGVFLYVEDQDQVDGSPQDLLYAAALLDWDPTTGEPAFDSIAYRAYLDPQTELELASISSYENNIIKRPRPYVRAVPLSIAGRFDLCNGAGRTLTPGIHTLSLIVTDRFWTMSEPDGGEGGPSGSSVTLEGVPDIAAGATYDIQTYVFSCFLDGDELCDCADLQDP